VRRHEPPYLLDGNSKDGDHLWTYLFLTRAIGATPWQKGFICRCHCLRCHYSPLTVEVIRHMDQSLQWPHWWACRRECHLSVDTSCKAHGVLDPCACSNHTDRAWHACWTS